jgi:LysR family transcriptional regulator, cell division regulator
MDLKDLEIFRELALQLNISKTAAKFNYVQSNITNRLAKLEAEVGCNLLTRTNKGVQLTLQGQTFLNYANKVLQLHKELQFDLFAEHAINEIKIGATDITTSSRLPHILKAFKNTYPAVKIALKNGSTAQLIKAVLNHELDGAFITNPIEHPKLDYHLVATEEVILISEKNAQPIRHLSEVQHKTMLVFSEGCTYRRLTEEWIQDEKVSINKMEMSTTESMINFVKAGLGVALLSKHIAEQSNGDQLLQFHQVPINYSNVETGFISFKNQEPAKLFISTMNKMNSTTSE